MRQCPFDSIDFEPGLAILPEGGGPDVVVMRKLPTLYYHCVCGKLLDAGGLPQETWVICPSCDQAHLPPLTVEDVPKPPKKRKPKTPTLSQAVASKNGSPQTKPGEVVDLDTDIRRETRPNFNPVSLEKTPAAPTDEPHPGPSRLRPPRRERLETISRQAVTSLNDPEPDPDRNHSPMSWNENEDDQVADFERSRRRKNRKAREGTIFRRVFFFTLFIVICGWTAWKCYDDWESVGASLILFLLCAGFCLYFAAADLVLAKDKD